MMARLGDYVNIKTGKLDANASSENGQYPFFTCSVTPLKIDTYSYDCECVLVAGNGDLNVKYYDGKFDAYQRTYIIQSKDKMVLSVPYIYCFLDKYVETLRKQSIGGVIKYIKLGNLTEAPIPVYNIEKQKEIVSKLDFVDALLTARREQLAKLDELVKSQFIELFGDPESNTNNWYMPTVEEAVVKGIIEKPLDGNHGNKHPKGSDYVKTGVPFIMANNLIDGKVDLVNCSFITKEQADSLDKGFAKDGDVLLTHKGTIGRTAILHCNLPYIMLTPQVTYYRPQKDVSAEYLKAYFDTYYFQTELMKVASAGSTRAYIGITAQLKLKLLIPPRELQEAFVSFVQQTDKSKFEIQQSLEKLETLKKALMQKYFG